MKVNYAYKVFMVRTRGLKRLTSCIVVNTRYSLEYPRNSWTTAPFGGCLCFSTQEDAFHFIDNYYLETDSQVAEVWIVEAREPVELPPYGAVREEDFESMWDEQRIQDVKETISWPRGTVAYRSIRPRKQIYRQFRLEDIEDGEVDDGENGISLKHFYGRKLSKNDQVFLGTLVQEARAGARRRDIAVAIANANMVANGEVPAGVRPPRGAYRAAHSCEQRLKKLGLIKLVPEDVATGKRSPGRPTVVIFPTEAGKVSAFSGRYEKPHAK